MDHHCAVFLVLCFLTIALGREINKTRNGQFVPLDIMPEGLGNEILLQNSGGRAGRIVLGSYAGINQFPYYGYTIIYRPKSTNFCGSTLISSEWLVTAAHCMRTAMSVIVYFGSVDRDYMKVSRNAAGYFVHEQFESPTIRANDIALIKLTSAVPLSSSIGIIKLPAHSEKSKAFSGITLTSCGFGQTHEGFPRYLQYTTITGMTNAECSRTHWVFRPDSMICGKGTNSAGSSVCYGDSGSKCFGV